MSDLSSAVINAIKDAGLGRDALWKHKQSGKHIIYHWACEKAAAHKGVWFDPPTIICADPEKKLATIVVTGHLGEAVEWSFGEAAPYNTAQTYPFAMAEKRGKDRVILKLLGLHGELYSEVESDEFRQQNGHHDAPAQPPPGTAPLDEIPDEPLPDAEDKPKRQRGEAKAQTVEERARALWKEISKAQKHDDLLELEVQNGDFIDSLPDDIRTPLTKHFEQCAAKLKEVT